VPEGLLATGKKGDGSLAAANARVMIAPAIALAASGP
jgi:hypothetical protein